MTSPHLTKLDAVAEMAGWQPIGCAPDDEPLLLIANRLVQNVLAFKEDGIWRSAETGDEMEDFHPTHWMRMPAPPSARQLVPALAGIVKAAWLAIEGAPHDELCESLRNRRLGLPPGDKPRPCDCWRGTALATLTQEVEKLNL